MFEILSFTIIFIILASVLTGFIFLSGYSFHLSLGDSWYLAVVTLIAFFPAFGNFYIFFNKKSEEDLTKRFFALFRGFGMAIIGVMFLCLLSIDNFSKTFIYGGFILGAFLWWGLLPFEDRYQSKKYQMANQSIKTSDDPQQHEEHE